MAAENKGNNALNDPKKRKRCYLPHNKGARKKGGSPIRPGVIGFFITCDGGREHQAAQEAINVIDYFFEELTSGKESSSKAAVSAEKPMNKKITFTYSDSDSDEEEGDEDNEGQQGDNKSINPPEDSVNNGSHVEISDHADKADQVDEVISEKTVDGNKEDENGQAEEKGEENANVQAEEKREDNANGQDEGKSEENDSKQAEGKSEESDNKQAEKKSEENEEPPQKKQCSDVKKSESGNQEHSTTELSVDKLIEAELKELKDKNKRRFSKLDTGCNGVVFVHMRRRDGDPGPTDIVQHMMESAASTKKHMSRFLLRVLPVELSCYASEEEISRAIKPLVEKHFPVDAETPARFAVQYDARANTGVERMKIIDAIAKSIPEPHKVDLKNPEKTIVAQVVKTVCMIGVVVKYKELAKYNLRQLTS